MWLDRAVGDHLEVSGRIDSTPDPESILSTSTTKANVDPVESSHERRGKKAPLDAPAITFPMFIGPQTAFPLIYRNNERSR